MLSLRKYQKGGSVVFPAHIRTEYGKCEIQTAVQHSRNTAFLAATRLSSIGLTQTGFLLGLVHDCGKFKEEFAAYLADPNGVRGSVNHTFAGCRLLLERYHAEDPIRRLVAEVLAVTVGSHHGLFDVIDEDRESGFLHRMTKQGIGYEESRDNFFRECITSRELDELFDQSVRELTAVLPKLAQTNIEEYMFRLSLLTRLLLSALIDGDRQDTAEFMCGIAIPTEPQDLSVFWKPYLERVERKLDRFPSDTPICRARREISDRCRAFAENPGGVYRLNVPTGGGKTLTSLRYALAHAQKWGKRRLIFTSPLLSILEQNAAVIRDFLEDDSIILEHHSNVLRTQDGFELDLRELAVESWNAPVIITTLVQLLNTLFEGRTTAIRRFQGLCNSVIVIDEVQTVPPKMLSMFNMAVDFLANICNATVLLCSATQPCLEETAHPVPGQIPDVIDRDLELWEPFRRTVITDAGGKTLEEIADFASDSLAEVQSLLVICNKKDEAQYLFDRLRDQTQMACHLSASMCTAHRRETLARLNRALASGQTCLCVATQVIEAGVDVSFHRVIRLAAGMDSVVQAAGRCNRHGESPEPVPVYVVDCLGEKLSYLREIAAGKAASIHLLDAYKRSPERFGRDLSSDSAIGAYYRKLYADMSDGYQDYPLPKRSTTIFELLSQNLHYYNERAPYAGAFFLQQAFKLAGAAFRVFENDSRDLVVPWGEGTALITELCAREQPDVAFLTNWVRRARPYTVCAYEWQLRQLGNAVTEYAGVAFLDPAFYDNDTGLMLRPKEQEFWEV